MKPRDCGSIVRLALTYAEIVECSTQLFGAILAEVGKQTLG